MRAVALLVGKDLRTLRRTPVLLGVLLAYPLVIAALVGLVAGYSNSKPRVAFVDEDGLPARLVVGTHSFNVRTTIDAVAQNVDLVRMSEDSARRELADGKVVAVITVPPGFVSTLQQMVTSPTLELGVTRGGTSGRVRQQVQALVYQLNLKLQRAYISANIAYVRLILHGGKGKFLGRTFNVIGLDGTAKELTALPQSGAGQEDRGLRARRAAGARRDGQRAARDRRADQAGRGAATRPLGARLRPGAELRVRVDAHVPGARARSRRARGGTRRERPRPPAARARPARRAGRREGRSGGSRLGRARGSPWRSASAS